jgi:hypothetical protein
MKKLIGGLRSNERVAAAYGRQLPIKGMNPFEERLLLATFLPDENGRMWPPFSNANCAIRKETWKQFPFDEKASFAEDFIWSQFLPAGTEIKYIAEAAVYHTHPLRLKYWAKRSYDNGVFVQYLKHVYGLQYRWVASNSGSRAASAVSGATRFCAMLARRAARSLEMIAFLIENGYLRFIPLLPIYVALEGYYYHRGLVDGLKLYGPARVR